MVRYDRETAERGAKYVDDRRGSGGTRRRGGGGKAVGGIGGLLLLIVGAIFGLDLTGGGGGGFGGIDATTGFDGGAVSTGSGTASSIDDDTEEFMSFLMFDIQETWDEYFTESGQLYQETKLVIFDGVVDTGCGRATAQVGPFYCPAPGDQQVYIDFEFYSDLSRRFGAPGDFAQAYVIAHEIGHHIQSITGISDAVRSAQASDPGNKNEYSIRQELQADCLAGVWANSASKRLTRVSGQPIIERGDISEGMVAAAAVGDDAIQASAGMRVDPHTWTHGSAAQRETWFLQGFDNGDPELCDPFQLDKDNP
ncbi:MAG: KPN_02809 family neutral zinc metallopeptidase [Acidimicrobiales bacterium]